MDLCCERSEVDVDYVYFFWHVFVSWVVVVDVILGGQGRMERKSGSWQASICNLALWKCESVCVCVCVCCVWHSLSPGCC